MGDEVGEGGGEGGEVLFFESQKHKMHKPPPQLGPRKGI